MKGKKVLVTIDEFSGELESKFCDEDWWNWTPDLLFEESEGCDGQKYKSLSVDGISKIIEMSVKILEDLHFEQFAENSCNKPCNICEGLTHHWIKDFEDDDDADVINPDEPVWKCKHCDHTVPYGETINHPSLCDCPDCYPEGDENNHWLCSCGNFIEDGLHCDKCRCEPPWGCPCSFCQDSCDDDENCYDYDYTDLI